MFSDPERAGLKLAELLAGRPRTLIVVDDVWGSSRLRPFLLGLSAQVRILVTTRDRSLAPLTATRIVVDAMEPTEARDMLEAGLPEPVKDEVANRFADGTGRWPVLLSLVHGAIRRTVNIGLSVQDAAEDVLRQLESQGPLAFDMRRAEDRHDAVRTTMEASLNLLEPNDLERYLDLAVFPEDVDIPVRVLYEWWTSVHGIGSDASERLVEDFQRLSLLAMLRRANGATAFASA